MIPRTAQQFQNLFLVLTKGMVVKAALKQLKYLMQKNFYQIIIYSTYLELMKFKMKVIVNIAKEFIQFIQLCIKLY